MQVVVPATKIEEALREMHNGSSGAHFGINKTLSKIRERFYWVRCRQDVESWCKKCRTCAAVQGLKIRGRGPMQAPNVGSPFGRTAGEVSGPLPVTEKGNKETKKEKLLSIHEMLRPKNGVASGRMKTCYDLRDNSVGFQAGDLVWLYNYNSRRWDGRRPKLSSDWEGPYTVVTRINDVVYRIRRGPKRKMKIVHLGRLMKYNSSAVDVSDRDDQN